LISLRKRVPSDYSSSTTMLLFSNLAGHVSCIVEPPPVGRDAIRQQAVSCFRTAQVRRENPPSTAVQTARARVLYWRRGFRVDLHDSTGVTTAQEDRRADCATMYYPAEPLHAPVLLRTCGTHYPTLQQHRRIMRPAGA